MLAEPSNIFLYPQLASTSKGVKFWVSATLPDENLSVRHQVLAEVMIKADARERPEGRFFGCRFSTFFARDLASNFSRSTAFLEVKNRALVMNEQQLDQTCYFCKVSRGEADPFIFENRSFVGVFDTHPVNPGHALVIARRHVVSLFDLNESEQADYFDALRGVKSAIETADLVELYRNMLHRPDLEDRPKDHIEAVLDLEFLGTMPDAYTVGNNDGREAGRSIDHLHVILLPRYRGDVVNPRGGIRNVIPDRANYPRR